MVNGSVLTAHLSTKTHLMEQNGPIFQMPGVRKPAAQ